MTMKKLGIKSRWDIAPAVLAVLLYGNFLVFLVLCAAAVGLVFLEPVVPVLTAVLLLLGIACHLATRRRTSKLWRRLLLGSIAANFLIVVFFVIAVWVMMAAWMDLAK